VNARDKHEMIMFAQQIGRAKNTKTGRKPSAALEATGPDVVFMNLFWNKA
jgi:hypothetical protein